MTDFWDVLGSAGFDSAVSEGRGDRGLRRSDVGLTARTLDEPLLNAAQVSELLGGIPTKTILQYARDGVLPCVRIGKHVRFVRSELADALDAHRPSADI